MKLFWAILKYTLYTIQWTAICTFFGFGVYMSFTAIEVVPTSTVVLLLFIATVPLMSVAVVFAFIWLRDLSKEKSAQYDALSDLQAEYNYDDDDDIDQLDFDWNRLNDPVYMNDYINDYLTKQRNIHKD